MSSSGATNSETTSPSGATVGTFLANVSASTTSAYVDCLTAHINATLYVIQNSSVVPTSVSTQMQGSLDAVNWYTLGSAQANTANGAYLISSNTTVFRYIRASATITGGTSVSITAQIGVAA